MPIGTLQCRRHLFFIRTPAISIRGAPAGDGVVGVDKAHGGVDGHAHTGGGHCDVGGLGETA